MHVLAPGLFRRLGMFVLLCLLVPAPARAAAEASIFVRAWFPELLGSPSPRSTLERQLREVATAALGGRHEEAERLLAPLKAAPEQDARFLAMVFDHEVQRHRTLLLGEVQPSTLLSELMRRGMLHLVRGMEHAPALMAQAQQLPPGRAWELSQFHHFTVWLWGCSAYAQAPEYSAQGLSQCLTPPQFPEVLLDEEARLVYLFVLGNVQYAIGERQRAAASHVEGAALARARGWRCAEGSFEARPGDLALGLQGSPPLLGQRLHDVAARMRFAMDGSLPPGPTPAVIALAKQSFDRAAPAFTQCGAVGALLAALRRVALEDARNKPQVAESWLEVIRAARALGHERFVAYASAAHALNTLTPDPVREAMKLLGERRDLSGVLSIAELGLDMAIQGQNLGHVGAAALALETLALGLEDSGLGHEVAPTRAVIAGELNRIYASQGMFERAINTSDEGIHQNRAYGLWVEQSLAEASPLTRQMLQQFQTLVRQQELTLLRPVVFQLDTATGLGLMLPDEATARAQSYAAREQELVRTIGLGLPPLPVTRAQEWRRLVTDLRSEMGARGETCAGWRRVHERLGAQVKQLGPDGREQNLGLHAQMLGTLARCDPDLHRPQALQFLQGLRPIEKLRASNVPRTEPPPPSESPQEAQLQLTIALNMALSMGELDLADAWLQDAEPLVAQATSRFIPPAEMTLFRARLYLRQGQSAKALELLRPWVADTNVDYPELPGLLAAFIDASVEAAPAEALLAWERRQRLLAARGWGRVGVTPSHPGSAERAALENRLARTGTLPKAERVRLTALRNLIRGPSPSQSRGTGTARLTQLLGRIPQDSTLYVFHLTERDEIVTWVLRRGSPLKVNRQRVNTATLFDDAADLAQALAESATDWPESAARLYPLFFPEAPGVTGTGRIIIATSAELSNVFFEVLAPLDELPLALRFPVVRTSRLFDDVQPSSATLRRPPVVIGFNGPGLTHAEAEAQDIARQVGTPATLLNGPDANRSRILESISGAELIHVAAHGRIDPANPVASSFQVAGDAPLEAFALFDATRSARLVVFSACDTLASGFGALAHWGGTRWAITTPWSIQDQRAIVVMSSFYEHLPQGDPASALHVARKRVVEQGRTVGHTLTDFLLSSRSAEAAF